MRLVSTSVDRQSNIQEIDNAIMWKKLRVILLEGEEMKNSYSQVLSLITLQYYCNCLVTILIRDPHIAEYNNK